jgi:hypothetical protein
MGLAFILDLSSSMSVLASSWNPLFYLAYSISEAAYFIHLLFYSTSYCVDGQLLQFDISPNSIPRFRKLASGLESKYISLPRIEV